MTTSSKTDLWELASNQPVIDAQKLARVIEDQARRSELDYRSRLLIRRSLETLQGAWGNHKYRRWMARSSERREFESILAEAFEEDGFPFLARCVVDTTKPETVKQYLRELGMLISQPCKLVIGGSISAILQGYLERRTEYIVVPDEIPATLRELGVRLDRLNDRYQIMITHFQSHYLPEGWSNRLHWFEDFGPISVYLVDIYDLFVGKLFSSREKDHDDLRVLIHSLDKQKIIDRLGDAEPLRSDRILEQAAEKNWYVLYGEDLPPGEVSASE